VTPVTDKTLLCACGVSASTAILGNAINECVRVKRIEIWTPPASQGASATCTVTFPQALQSQAREYTDTTVSTAIPAHVVCTPPSHSLCSFWQNGSLNTPLFYLSAPPGSIIDVWVSTVLNDPFGTLQTATLVAASVGGIYYCSLDSTTKAGSIYTAVGLSSV
jgi:hypothetical protein